MGEARNSLQLKFLPHTKANEHETSIEMSNIDNLPPVQTDIQAVIDQKALDDELSSQNAERTAKQHMNKSDPDLLTQSTKLKSQNVVTSPSDLPGYDPPTIPRDDYQDTGHQLESSSNQSKSSLSFNQGLDQDSPRSEREAFTLKAPRLLTHGMPVFTRHNKRMVIFYLGKQFKLCTLPLQFSVRDRNPQQKLHLILLT